MFKLSFVIFLCTATGISYHFISETRWLLDSPSVRFQKIVNADFERLQTTTETEKTFKNLRKIEVSYPDASFTEWADVIRYPVKIHAEGNTVLKITVLRWINNYKYGATVQLEFFRKEQKVNELGRTYFIGYIW